MAASEVILLDGGTGTELRDRGVDVACHRTSIWSARALLQAPEQVIAVHRDYIDAGARVITACNYAVTPILLGREGMGHRVRELSELALDLACQAREQSQADVRIAASVPPLDTSYRADLVADDDELREGYEHLVQAVSARADLLLCETMALGREGRIAVQAALQSEKEVWLSWTLQGNRHGLLPSGETLEAALDGVADLPVQAHLVNCCAANLVTDAIPRLAEQTTGPLGGYANAVDALPGPFDPLDPETFESRPLDPVEYAAAVERWVAAGATLVGGCCHTGPAHIDEIRSRLSS